MAFLPERKLWFQQIAGLLSAIIDIYNKIQVYNNPPFLFAESVACVYIFVSV